MRITKTPPPRPSPVFHMEFNADEGWGIVAALTQYAGRNPVAAHRERWLAWAYELDALLRAAASGGEE